MTQTLMLQLYNFLNNNNNKKRQIKTVKWVSMIGDGDDLTGTRCAAEHSDFPKIYLSVAMANLFQFP